MAEDYVANTINRLKSIGPFWVGDGTLMPMWDAYSDLFCASWMDDVMCSDDYLRGMMVGWAAHERHIQNTTPKE